ncbi:MAG TPA: hypothetical protein DCQ83_02295, partial [Fibrobacteres bacterium]|nr:hypothetical protein [Fibrobacterota bacterium]
LHGQTAYLFSSATGGSTSLSNLGGGLKTSNPYTISPAVPSGWTFSASTGVVTVPSSSFSGKRRYTIIAQGSGPLNDTTQLTITSAEDYTAWSNHITIGINTSSGLSGAATTTGVAYFPLLVRLDSTNFNFNQSSDTLGTDIRFTKSDNVTPLPYQIESWQNNAKSAALWVLMDTVAPANNSQTIRMHWGNNSVSSQANVGAAVFDTANGFVGVWHLGDATGINARPNAVAGAPSATPSNNNATFGGGAGTYVIPSGMIGKADTLRGGGTRAAPVSTSDYLNIGSAADVASGNYDGQNSYTGYSNFSTGFTFSLWLKPATSRISAFTYLMELANTNGGNGNIQVFRPSGLDSLRFENVNGSTSGGTPTSSIADYFTGGAWHYVTVTSAGTAGGTVSMYLNGVAVSQTATTSSQAISNVLRTNAWLGKSNYTGDGYFAGTFDEPQISKTVRSADWIKLSYQTQFATQTAVVMPLDSVKYPAAQSFTAGNAVTLTPVLYGTATSFSIISGSLPSPLALNATTGVITGTLPAATSGTFPVTIRALNSMGNSYNVSLNITVSNGVAPIITSNPAASQSAKMGATVKFGVVVNTGNAAVTYKWVRNGTDTLSGSTGGVPTTSGVDTLTRTNITPADTGVYVCAVFNSFGAPVVSTNAVLLGAPKAVYSAPFNFVAATGGTISAPVTSSGGALNATPFSIFPPLPTGWSLNTTTGVITIAAASTSYSGVMREGVVATGPGGSDTTYINVSASEDYTQWTKGRNIRINTSSTSGGANVATTQFLFPLAIRLDSTNFNFTEADVNGADLRFTKADGVTPLSYQIENWSQSGKNAVAWVLVDTLKGNNSSQFIKMLWGKSSPTTQSRPGAVFSTASNFQGVWHMNKGDTTGELDATPNAFNLSNNASSPRAASTSSGAIGLARTFASASSQFMVALNSASSALSLPFGGPFTLSSWVNPTTNGQTVIMGKGDNQFALQENASSFFEGSDYQTGTSTTPGWFSVTQGSVPSTGVWSHVVFVRPSTAAESLYVNGTLVSTTVATSSSATARNTSFNLHIGTLVSGTAPGTQSAGTHARYWNGSIDEVEISNTVRSAAWNKLSYATQVTTQTAVVQSLDSIRYSPATYTANSAFSLAPVTYGTATSYSITSGTLPSGLTFNTSTGVISGTATTASSNNITVMATNILGGSASSSFTLTVNGALVTGVNYYPSNTVYEVNQVILPNRPVLTTGSQPITYSIDTSNVKPLPAGLSFDLSTGTLSGTPTTTSSSTNFTVTASNGTVPVGTGALTITILSAESYSGSFKDFTLNTGALGANVATGQGKFPVLIRLSNVHRAIFQQAASGGADIRFANASGSHLAYQIEKWSTISSDTSAAIWVQVDTVNSTSSNSGLTTIRMYWNTGLSSRSNGAAVFNNGYEAVYHLSETGLVAGDTSADATGNGHTATLAINGSGTGANAPGDPTDGIGIAKSFSGNNTTTTANGGIGPYFTLADTNTAYAGLNLNTKNGPWT